MRLRRKKTVADPGYIMNKEKTMGIMPGARILAVTGLSLLLMSVSLGCTQHYSKTENVKLPAPAIEEPNYIFHKVRPGETLASIALWYSGSDRNWETIARDNPTLDPNRLRVGDIIKVPVSLATRHSEQANFSTAPKPKTDEATSDSEIVPTGSETAPSVFGPK